MSEYYKIPFATEIDIQQSSLGPIVRESEVAFYPKIYPLSDLERGEQEYLEEARRRITHRNIPSLPQGTHVFYAPSATIPGISLTVNDANAYFTTFHSTHLDKDGITFPFEKMGYALGDYAGLQKFLMQYLLLRIDSQKAISPEELQEQSNIIPLRRIKRAV